MSAQVATSESEASVMATSSQESTNQEPAIQPKITITTTDELVRLQTKALDKLAQIEDCLQVLKGHKRAYKAIDISIDQSGSATGRIDRPPWARDSLISLSHHSSLSYTNRASTIREQKSSSDSDSIPCHPKRACYSYTRGIKIILSYIFITGSSLRE